MKPKKSVFSRLALPASILIGSLAAVSSASAQTYTAPAASGTQTWSSGTNWSATPSSSLDTELTFSGTLDPTAAIVSNNDIVGAFQLNKLTFNASGTTTAGTYTIQGSQLNFRNNTSATAPTMVFNGGTTAPALTISNALLLTNDLAITATTNATLSGAITGNSNLSVTGGGTLVLSNNTSTFGGVGKTITVQGGSTLRSANGGSNQPVFGSTSNTIILNGGTITMVPNNDPSLQLANALTLNTGGANFINVSPGSGANRGVSMSGLVTGSGGFTFASSIGAPLALTNTANSLSGTVSVASGTLMVVGNSTVDALGTAALSLGGGNTIFTGSVANAGPINFSRAITLTGNASLGAGEGYTLTQTGTLTGTNTLSINTSSASQFTNTTMANRNINSGANSVVALSGTNTGFSGNVAIGRGTVALGNDTALGVGGTFTMSATSGVRSTSTATRTIAKTLGTFAGTTATYTYGSTESSLNGNLSFTSTTAASLGTSAGRTFQVHNATTFANAFSGTGSSITKTGTGTMILNNTNTYTGGTNVNAGTLLVGNTVGSTASLSTSGAVAVGADGTLGGNGTIGGATTITGGTLAAGASAGSLAFSNNLTIVGASSSTAIELGGKNFDLNMTEDYDRIKLTGAMATLTLDGTLDISLINGFTLGASEIFGIFQLETGATVSGLFKDALGMDLAEGATVGNFSGRDLFITYAANVGDNTISQFGGNDIALFTAVPEPSSALLLLGGLGMLLGFRRR